jgi:SAM-dependent methyltransferase
LGLSENIFRGKTILDIGSGPIPSASVFKSCKLYCLDPLLHKYLECGYPLHYYADNIKFIHGYSENIPIEDNFFDAVVAVNAIDHVDDLEKTAKELYRVLKRNGKLAMHVHYHKPCPEEPLEINDAIFLNAFSWCKNFKKIKETKEKFGYKLKAKDETYVLWRNF